MTTRRVQVGVGLILSGVDQDEGSYTSIEGDSLRLEGQVETEPRESSQQQHHDEQEKPLTFKRTVTKDSLCLILANLHPRDGLKVLYLCCSIRSLAGKELWEWWALALWPKRVVLPSVPRLYPDFEALVRDDNRRGAILTLKWPYVGNDQTVCFYMGNRTWYYFACRVLAVEYDRHQSLLSVHFDVRGEGDLVKPGYARILLGPKGLEIASPIPHELCRAIPKRDSFRAVPLPTVVGVEGSIDYEWGYCWENNKRCTGHVTFDMSRFEECLHPASADGSPLQLKFVYSRNPPYTPVTLAEWPASKRLSVTEALTEHSCHDPEIGMHATGEMSGILDASGGNGTADDAKKRFDFVPDYVKSRPEWWV